MADDSFPPDLVTAIEEALAGSKHARKLARQEMPGEQVLRDRPTTATPVQEEDPFEQAADIADEEWAAECREQRARRLLRLMVLVGLIFSFGLLYGQWMIGLNGGSKFSFRLSNTWPTLVFGSLLVGLLLEQAFAWVQHKAYLVGVWSRTRPFKEPHWQDCACKPCRLKRRWKYWRTLQRYPYRKRWFH